MKITMNIGLDKIIENSVCGSNNLPDNTTVEGLKVDLSLEYEASETVEAVKTMGMMVKEAIALKKNSDNIAAAKEQNKDCSCCKDDKKEIVEFDIHDFKIPANIDIQQFKGLVADLEGMLSDNCDAEDTDKAEDVLKVAIHQLHQREFNYNDGLTISELQAKIYNKIHDIKAARGDWDA